MQGNVLSPLVVIWRPRAWTSSTGNERVRFSPWRAPSAFQRAPLRKTLGVRRCCRKRRPIILHFGNGRHGGLCFPRARTLGICVLAACQTPRQDIRADQFPGQPPLPQGGRGHLHGFGFCPIRSTLLRPIRASFCAICNTRWTRRPWRRTPIRLRLARHGHRQMRQKFDPK